MNNCQKILLRLAKSKFRSCFHLGDKEIFYIKEKGLPLIEKHAYDFINKRLAPEFIFNDGKQTPMKGHPIFIAQHATATCCRKCLYKWYNIPMNRCLRKEEINYIVEVIMLWIKAEIK